MAATALKSFDMSTICAWAKPAAVSDPATILWLARVDSEAE